MSEFLLVGASEVDITPKVGLAMDGYVGREGVNLGTHDPLMAQVLILKRESHQPLIIVALDVLAVSAAFTDPMRQQLADVVGTVPEAVIICPSHTHCGPCGLQTWFPMGEKPQLDMQLVTYIQAQVMTAAYAAHAQMEAVQLVWRVGEVSGIGGDRNQPGVPVDSQVTTMCCERLDGSVKCILFHYACHPTVLGADTRYYSADFIGVTRKHLQVIHPRTICMYINGALGDISTRYQRRDQSYGEVERMGEVLAACILTMLEMPASADTSLNLTWETVAIDLPFRSLSEATAPVLITDTSNRIELTRAQGSILQTQLQDALHGRSFQLAVLTRLKIGMWELLCIPGEPFSELASHIRRVAPQALVVGLVNDYVGYFPTDKAIDMQTYEALSSPYDARTLHLMETTFLKMDHANLTN